MFDKLQDADPLLAELVLLVKLAALEGRNGCSAERKYAFFYYAVRAGALVDIIVAKRKPCDLDEPALKKADLTALKDHKSETVNLLSPLEQCALFRVMRNVAADYFHYMDEGSCVEFFTEFCRLLDGRNCAEYAARTKSAFRKIEGGIYKQLKKQDRVLAVNVLAQMKYFLEKVQFFIERENFQGACMALVAAGNCAKDFNLSTFNQRKMMVTGDLKNLRDNDFAHQYEEIAIKVSLVKDLKIFPDYIRRIIEEAQVGHGLDVKDAAKLLGDHSPRMYRK